MMIKTAKLFVSAVTAKILLLRTTLTVVRDDCSACHGQQSLRFQLAGDEQHLRGYCELCDVEFLE